MSIAEVGGAPGRIDDVGEHHGREHPVGVLRGMERLDLLRRPGVGVRRTCRRACPVRLVDQVDRAGSEGPGADEPEMARVGLVAEEPLAAAEDDREEHQSVLVDQVGVHQPTDEVGAAVAQDVAVDPILERADLGRPDRPG